LVPFRGDREGGNLRLVERSAGSAHVRTSLRLSSSVTGSVAVTFR
jgi:hypothetical protein